MREVGWRHLLIVALLIAAIWPAALSAAEPLTEQFQSDEGFGFRYPTGWFVEEKEGRFGLTNLENGLVNSQPEEGQTQVFFFPTIDLLVEQLATDRDVVPEQTPVGVIRWLIEEAELGSSAKPVSTRINGQPAARAEASQDDLFLMMVAVDVGQGRVVTGMAACNAAERATWRPLMLSVLNSVSQGAADEAVGAQMRQWAVSAEASSQYADDQYSAAQAIGKANVDSCGDDGRAWAAKEKDTAETLTVMFDEPVFPYRLDIYQTYNPGAIVKVELLPADGGDPVAVPNSADRVQTCPHVFRLKVPADMPAVSGAVIHIDQSLVDSWAEIDGVELLGKPSDTSRIRQWATLAEATSQYGDDDWSARQAVGAPDVNKCGDDKMAWASASSDGEETLTVWFDTPVIPTQVNIHQTHAPGSIQSVDLLPADGGESIQVADSADPDQTCPHIFQLEITETMPAVDGVAIHLDQAEIASWNEIDAVELIGKAP